MSAEYLGKTIQTVPHVTTEIIKRLQMLLVGHDVVIVEMGGTVGDMESEIFFYFAMKQLHRQLGRDAVCHVHVSMLLQTAGNELKTKPTQQSVIELNRRGIYPDVLCLRLPSGVSTIGPDLVGKIEMYCNCRKVLLSPNCQSVYEVPQIFYEQDIVSFYCLSSERNGVHDTTAAHRWCQYNT